MNDPRILRSSDLPDFLVHTHDSTVHLAYGHFSVIHPGHIRYLKNASKNADLLVVALQNDLLVRGSNRFRFDEQERSYGLLSTQLCDYVLILDNDDLFSLLHLLNPDKFFLGTEYQSKNIPPSVAKALKYAANHDINVSFSSGSLEFASSDLFRLDVVDQIDEKRNTFLAVCNKIGVTKSTLLQLLDQISQVNITVIGDTIVDEYAACEALGMSAEAPVLVVKEIELQTFVGGAAIVAAHANALGAKTSFLSVLGDDPNQHIVSHQLSDWNINDLTIIDDSRPTTYKKRYMVENQKLFRVSKLEDSHISASLETSILKILDSVLPVSDGLIFSDFAYGVITDRIIDYVSSRSTALTVCADVQCSSQIASITKYKNIDLICPNEREARLALQDNTSGIEILAHNLMQACNVKYLIMKLDSKGFIAYHQTSPGVFSNQYFPALSANPVDVTGAGDSLLSIMALCLSADINFFDAASLACIMCSIAVEQIGNKPINFDKLRQKIDFYFQA